MPERRSAEVLSAAVETGTGCDPGAGEEVLPPPIPVAAGEADAGGAIGGVILAFSAGGIAL
jgi:hypothetical protein